MDGVLGESARIAYRFRVGLMPVVAPEPALSESESAGRHRMLTADGFSKMAARLLVKCHNR